MRYISTIVHCPKRGNIDEADYIGRPVYFTQKFSNQATKIHLPLASIVSNVFTFIVLLSSLIEHAQSWKSSEPSDLLKN